MVVVGVGTLLATTSSRGMRASQGLEEDFIGVTSLAELSFSLWDSLFFCLKGGVEVAGVAAFVVQEGLFTKEESAMSVSVLVELPLSALVAGGGLLSGAVLLESREGFVEWVDPDWIVVAVPLATQTEL